MTSDELKEAMAKGIPVVWKGSSGFYKVSGIIMRYTGRFVFQVELKDVKTNSVIIVKAKDVSKQEVQS